MTVSTTGLKMLGDVAVSVTVELGRTHLPLKEVLALDAESVVPLDRLTDELLDVLVNGKPIARAEVVTQDGRFAMRIVELLGGEGANGDDAAARMAAAAAEAAMAEKP